MALRADSNDVRHRFRRHYVKNVGANIAARLPKRRFRLQLRHGRVIAGFWPSYSSGVHRKRQNFIFGPQSRASPQYRSFLMTFRTVSLAFASVIALATAPAMAATASPSTPAAAHATHAVAPAASRAATTTRTAATPARPAVTRPVAAHAAAAPAAAKPARAAAPARLTRAAAPAPAATHARGPQGATARCHDNSYSHATNHAGACAGHGGVATWY